MKRKIRKVIKKLMFGYRCDSDTYVAHCRSIGMRIGEETRIFSPQSVIIDQSRPWMVEIGKNVQITDGVTILTHGFDWSVLKGITGEVLGSSGKVTIKDNVFIGMKSTILKGVTVGNNVIIGAGSLVTKDIPDNVVAVGCPAKPIMSIEEYYEKRKNAQYAEAKELIREYRKVYGKEPGPAELSEFFWLFTDGNDEISHKSWRYQMKQAGNKEKSYEVLKQHKKMFESMEEFLNSI